MTQEQYENLTKLENAANDYRTRVISTAISVELMISQILINFFGFTKDVKDSVNTYLFSDTLTFEKKISLFNSLHKKNLH